MVNQQQLSKLEEKLKNLDGDTGKFREAKESYKKQIDCINKEIRDFCSLKEQVPQIKSKLTNLKRRKDGFLSRKLELEKEKEGILLKIEQRAKLLDAEPILSNKRTRGIDESIEKIAYSIYSTEVEIKRLSSQVSTSYRVDFERVKMGEIETIKRKIKKIDESIEKIWKDKKQLPGLILEVKMLPQYLEYAEKHRIDYDSEDGYDIFRQCNEHHHYILLDGYETYTKCRKQGRECSEDVILSVWNKQIQGDCSCGFARWCQEDPPEDLSEFNITSTHVYGDLDWSCY